VSPIREYRWTVRQGPQDPEAQAAVKKLADELGVSPVLSDILVSRGIDSFEKARAFFRPALEDLHDPFLMDGMSEAVDRILRAVHSNEHCIVYGDYDVDGTDGTAMVWTFLKSVGATADYLIPERLKDGYGLSQNGIDRARALGATLIVAIDCGITAVEQVEYARSLGIDVIICDHHEPGGTLPQAAAVLDPLKPSCRYPFKYLCGCGVGFKLIQALASQNEIRARLGDTGDKRLFQYLQYVTLATTADIVPLSGENRTMVKLGLELVNFDPLPGIRAIIETSGIVRGRISSGQIVFVLAPRINAVGRLGDAGRAVELLTCDSYERALELARVMEDENIQRRKIDEETFLQAQEIVEQVLNADNDSAIVLHQERWHPGVIGIVASRLVDRYYRPTILMTTVDGVAKGSARSVSGFNIFEALKRCEDKLVRFGGHKYAAGLTVEVNRLEDFTQTFKQVANELLTEELRTPEIRIEAEIQLGDLTPKFVRILSQFAPFGPENMRPVFAARNVEILGSPRIVGRNHLRFKVRSPARGIFDAIGFNLGDLISRIQPGRRVDVAFSLDEGEYAGETVPQLKIRDIKAL